MDHSERIRVKFLADNDDYRVRKGTELNLPERMAKELLKNKLAEAVDVGDPKKFHNNENTHYNPKTGPKSKKPAGPKENKDSGSGKGGGKNADQGKGPDSSDNSSKDKINNPDAGDE